MSAFLDDLELQLSWLAEPLADALIDTERLCETAEGGDDVRWWANMVRERVKALDANRASLVSCVAVYRELTTHQAARKPKT